MAQTYRPSFGEQIGQLLIGPAGRKTSDQRITTIPGAKGNVFYGPYILLEPGHYFARFVFEIEPDASLDSEPGLFLEAALGSDLLARKKVRASALEMQIVHLNFTVPASRSNEHNFEIRLESKGVGTVALSSVRIARRTPQSEALNPEQSARSRLAKKIGAHNAVSWLLARIPRFKADGPQSQPSAASGVLENEVVLLRNDLIDINSDLSELGSHVEQLDRSWSQHTPGFLNALTTVNRVCHEIVGVRRDIELLKGQMTDLLAREQSVKGPNSDRG